MGRFRPHFLRNFITLDSRDKLIKIEKLFTLIQMIKGKLGSEVRKKNTWFWLQAWLDLGADGPSDVPKVTEGAWLCAFALVTQKDPV